MVAVPKSVRVPSESEIGKALRDAATSGKSVIVEAGDATYTVEVESTPPAQPAEYALRKPTPEEVARSIEGIERTAGAWVGLVDAEAFKGYIRERRRTSSRPPVKL
ncbi:MAG TPA: hypothetical protein VKB09_06780 [Thermomicrobiales bacterium]|nr:hypothetical protein [Thermomicrobiales bacterium]